MDKEDFSRVENETFYTSPPYKYRPSIAEYLTTGNVTINGLVADIMHMDHKKDIKIIEIKDNIFKIKLIKSKELNLSEIIIWDYLSSLEQKGEIILDIDNIPRKVKNNFFSNVRRKSYEKFNKTLFNFNTDQKSLNNPYSNGSLITSRIITGFIFTLFNFGGLLSFLFLIIGLNKIAKEPKDLKFFGKNFIWRYVKISIFYIFIFIMIFLLSFYFFNKSPNIEFEIIIGISIALLYIYAFYLYSCIIYDYLAWIFESKEARQQRIDWLEFKKFVIDNSEIEKSPLSHYKLWGPFYYYTLAVGGMEKY